MNIFALDDDPVKAAKWQTDRHVVKMCLESAQLLCAPFEPGTAPYRRTHYNHPCCKWVRASKANYLWLIEHARALCNEYTARYNKKHKSSAVIEWCAEHCNDLNLPAIARTAFAQAMPEEFKDTDPVRAYRRYYKFGKAHLHAWKQNRPPWLNALKRKQTHAQGTV